jgi:excisionase family DNA binding protein
MTARFERAHPRLLNVAEAAAYLGLGESTLNKLRSSGGGPEFIKMGASVRYSERDLEKYIAANRVKSTAGRAA